MHAAGGLSERGHVGQVTSHVRGSGPLVSHKLARAGLWLSLLGLLAKIIGGAYQGGSLSDDDDGGGRSADPPGAATEYRAI